MQLRCDIVPGVPAVSSGVIDDSAGRNAVALGSRSDSGVPVLPRPRASGFPAPTRTVRTDALAFAAAREQAGAHRVLRGSSVMAAVAFPTRSWSLCGGPVNLPPNPAVERTGRFMASASVGFGAAGRSP